MKKLITAIFSFGILAGAYAIAFGVPMQVAQLWGGTAPVESAAPQSGGSGGPPGGPPGGRPGRGGNTTVVLAPLEERNYNLVLRTVGSAVSLHRAEVVATEAGLSLIHI